MKRTKIALLACIGLTAWVIVLSPVRSPDKVALSAVQMRFKPPVVMSEEDLLPIASERIQSYGMTTISYQVSGYVTYGAWARHLGVGYSAGDTQQARLFMVAVRGSGFYHGLGGGYGGGPHPMTAFTITLNAVTGQELGTSSEFIDPHMMPAAILVPPTYVVPTPEATQELRR
ncbi:MAG: hypothetical protein H7Y11_10985 [Armatimonadetes bacterium]|nr:hypothetical protein [Anaerolineae bacterium]